MKWIFIFSCILYCATTPCLISQVIYVDANATGSADGTSWNDAYPSLKDALSAASGGDTIWVAMGTYLPTTDDNRDSSFVLKDGVKMFGGFTGTESALAERDWEANPTVLSGDIGLPGDSTDNSYTILYMRDVGSATLVDGFYFLYGNADASVSDIAPATCGGAMYIDGSDAEAHPRIWNCRFEANYAKLCGGAVYVDGSNDGSVAPQFYNCFFYSNVADHTGGAIQRDGGSWTGTKNDFRDCTFEGNWAPRGACIYYLESDRIDTIEFVGCYFGVNGNLYGPNSSFATQLFFDGGRTTGGSRIVLDRCNSEFDLLSRNGGFYVTSLNGLGIKNITLSDCGFTFDIHASFFVIMEEDTAEIWVDSLTYQNSYIEINTEGSKYAILNIDGYYAIPALMEIFHNRLTIWGFNEVNMENLNFNKKVNWFWTMLDIITTGSVKSMNSLFVNAKTSYGGILLHSNLLWPETGVTDTLSNCTIANEVSPGVLYGSLSFANLYLTNSIIVHDSLHQNLLGFGVDTLLIEHSLITSEECPSYQEDPDMEFFPPVIICGEGNLFGLDPMFVDTAAGDYHLLPCSPARNAGDNSIVAGLGIVEDYDGRPRILEGAVDMGAYEIPEYEVVIDSVGYPVCAGGTGGFTATVNGGCPPFTLEFSGSSSVKDTTFFTVEGLPKGTYAFVLTDNDGRVDSFEVIISAPSAIELELMSVPVECAEGALGSAAVTMAEGGTGDLSFEWETGENGAAVSGLLPGIYTVTVEDSSGCFVIDSVEVGIEGELSLTGQSSAETCFGYSDGSAAFVPSGSAPYFWLWGDGRTDSVLTNLVAGIYSATVTDGIGCTGTEVVEVGGPDSLTVTFGGPDSLCHGAMAGELAATVAGGTPPYEFIWDIGSMDSILSGIGGGTYLLTVMDKNGCEASAQGTIMEFLPIQVTDTVVNTGGSASGDGSITVLDVWGGSGPPYTFLWDTGDTTRTLSNLLPGDYGLTVTDAWGCTGEFLFTVDIGVAVLEIPGSGIEVSMLPNPVSVGSSVWLVIDATRPAHLLFSMSDVRGSQVLLGQLEVAAGRSRHPIRLPRTAGVYFLKVEDPKSEGKVVLRVVVQ